MTTASELARLERVALRSVWTSEPNGFTPWLAQPSNLKVLSEALNMDLKIEGQEERVGPFRADILCRDYQDGSWVLIENQLERTDHGHLGQLLTYAAGLQTVTIIWIAQTFTEEHRAALDWLNEITDEKFRFFGLEIELWRIEDSPTAPKFNIVSRPNSWSKATQRSATGEIGPTALQQKRFWEEFSRFLSNRNQSVQLPNPPARAWTFYGIGRTGFQLCAQLTPSAKRISVELRITGPDSKDYFDLLSKRKDEIEVAVGHQLDWAKQPTTAVSRITLAHEADPTDEGDWLNQRHWFSETLNQFKSAFEQRVRDLDVASLQLDGEFNTE